MPRGEISVAIFCDADSDRPDYGGPRFDVREPLSWRGLTDGVPELLLALSAVRDSNGANSVITWLVRADTQIEQCHGRPDWALKSLADVWSRVRDAGHTIGWHPHHWRWSEAYGCWIQEWLDAQWRERNLELGASAFPSVPTICRMGWHSMDEFTMNHLNKLGVRLDVSAIPGMRRQGGPDKRGSAFVGRYSWLRCKKTAYRPHPSDYEAHSIQPTGIVELPCTTVDSGILSGLLEIRYRLRGGGGFVGKAAAVNITAHPILFRTMINHALALATQTGGFLLVVGFHPDELLDIGPHIGRLRLYSVAHVAANLTNLRRRAENAGLSLRFVGLDSLIPDLEAKFHREFQDRPRAEMLAPERIELSITLHKAAFQAAEADHDREAWLKWKHLDAPEDGPRIAAVSHSDKLIAQEPALALRVLFFGREERAGLICDSASHPDFQGSGAFAAAARFQYDQLRNEGFAFAMGFPNSRIYPIRTRSLAWMPVAPLPVMIRPIRPGAFFGRLLGLLPLLQSGSQQNQMLKSGVEDGAADAPWFAVDRFGDETNIIWSDAAERLKLAVIRDADRMNRRYTGAPGDPYRRFLIKENGAPVGVLVLRKMLKKKIRLLVICELLIIKSKLHQLSRIIHQIVEYGKADGADAVGACCFSHQPEYFHFLKNCFAPVPFKMHPDPTVFSVYSLNKDLADERLYERRSWYLSWGDTDNV